jgi:ribosome-binding protein aMBF1 (putative translation factor)
MAKYETGGITGDSEGACELCGTEDGPLQDATVAGARLEVCGSCAKHGEPSKSTRSGGTGQADQRGDRKQRTARNIARFNDARSGDSSHWEEHGTDYSDDPLPYLVSGYGARLKSAREAAELEPAELAEMAEISEEDVTAVEGGRANRADIGGSVIGALEAQLDLKLAEDS